MSELARRDSSGVSGAEKPLDGLTITTLFFAQTVGAIHSKILSCCAGIAMKSMGMGIKSSCIENSLRIIELIWIPSRRGMKSIGMKLKEFTKSIGGDMS